jgi:hypothetical protein
MLLGN